MPKKQKPPFDITNERKLTDQDVLVIRAVHIPRSPRFGSVILAQLFGVSQPTIDRVVKRETYRHLHPLLLPGRELWQGSDYLGRSGMKFGLWDARNKTEYNAARPDLRDEFAKGGYVDGLKGHYDEPAVVYEYVYAARPVRRVITPEGAERRRMKYAAKTAARYAWWTARAKARFGDAYNERIARATVGLDPRMPMEEFLALGGVRGHTAAISTDIYDDDPLDIPDF